MLQTRYGLAATLGKDKSVLEVACGSGNGLGCVASKASRVVGGDSTENLLRIARQHYGQRIPLVLLDAQHLPFRSERFDLVILYEALYYLPEPELFLHECHRVLTGNGTVLICSVNREWADFNPSPFSQQYLSARELKRLLEREGFHAEIFGAFPVQKKTLRDGVVSLVKRIAVWLHLIPKTMKGKEWLKRIFLGNLTPIPAEIGEGMAPLSSLVPLPSGAATSGYKVIYAIGHANQGGGEPLRDHA
jgi:SAM-dependent methyltransferase